MSPINNYAVQIRRLAVSRRALRTSCFVFLCTSAVFVRLLFAGDPFSFDYRAYISIIESLSELSFSEIIGAKLIFPYTVSDGIVAIEFGFALLVKAFSLLGFGSEVSYALIAATSVGIRVLTMRLLCVPVVWTLWINVIAITLMEANALRLGVATSVLLFGLGQLLRSRKLFGLLAMAISLTFHLQAVLFIAPFLVFYLGSRWISRSRLRFMLTLAGTSIIMLFVSELLPLLPNEKLQQYVALGVSGSSGITLTSVLAFLLLAASAISLRKGQTLHVEQRLFAAILAACVPSVFLLMFLTNVAVVGDRSWQFAFLVFSTFFFTDWANSKLKLPPLFLLIVITLVMQANVLIRYPLSNFFSPPFPEIGYSARP